MLLKLVERYRYKEYHKGLSTFLFEFDTLTYEVIDLIAEINSLESDKNFIKMEQHKKIKGCLCRDRPYIESLLEHDKFYLNDYDMLIGSDVLPNHYVVASIMKNNKITHILINRRRFDSVLINDNGEEISNNVFV